MTKQSNILALLIILSFLSLGSCRRRNQESGLKREIAGNLMDVRYGITSGVFARIFAKNVCSCLFVSGLNNRHFDLPYCMEQSNLYFALNIKGNLEPVYLDWIMKIRADVTRDKSQLEGEPVYVTASGSKSISGLNDSPDGIAVFDPKYPEYGCRIVARKG